MSFQFAEKLRQRLLFFIGLTDFLKPIPGMIQILLNNSNKQVNLSSFRKRTLHLTVHGWSLSLPPTVLGFALACASNPLRTIGFELARGLYISKDSATPLTGEDSVMADISQPALFQ